MERQGLRTTLSLKDAGFGCFEVDEDEEVDDQIQEEVEEEFSKKKEKKIKITLEED